MTNYTISIAIVCISGLEGLAMISNVDGTTFLPVIALIGGLAGYHVRPLAENVVKKARR